MSTADRDAVRIAWYRTPLAPEELAAFNRRSDLLGLLQTLGYLGVLALTGTAAFLAWGRLPWPAVVALFFLHGTVFAFLLNGFHELVHGSVFRSRFLNAAFLRLFSFLSWNSHVAFRESHMRHHQYTLHPPHDGEVVLPIRLTLKGFLLGSFVNLPGLRWVLKGTVRHACGRLNSAWEETLFPATEPEKRRRLARWARVTLGGHLLLLALCAWFRLWPLALLLSGARFYGEWLLYLCNNTQHVGLRDNVPDFRLCCRTIRLNPLLRFLYWHMNYHTEHHMYAAVPCYRLGGLHARIRKDLPPCPDGLVATWQGIVAILRRQRAEPAYQYAAPLPAPERGGPARAA